MRGRVARIVEMFFRCTTLHGLKYMHSPYYLDRLVWACWCSLCVCGAGVLCSAVWARFLAAPLLLSRVSLSASPTAPLVALCPQPYHAAQLLADTFSINLTEASWLPILFSKILRGKPAMDEHRLLLDAMLSEHNTTLSEALVGMSPCKEMMRRCRWRHSAAPCKRLFAKELTRWGACCVMRAERLIELRSMSAYLETTERLDMAMDCYFQRKYDSYCCELFIKYRGEEWLGPWHLASGRVYAAQLSSTSIHDPVKEKLVDGTCVSAPRYSHSRCMILCRETECGCSHPLRLKEEFETHLPPPCSVARMKCLGNFIRNNRERCLCLPACQRITAYMSVESIAISETIKSFNQIYDDVNSNSIVLHIHMKMSGSKSYELIPTESWLTLLSSLGGVFNMFLGVGLFSFLECLVLLAKLPTSCIHPSSERLLTLPNN